ncbi:ECF transporter S component [Calorimonas adulescens]|jgi:hypothetical protein|uniref:ECF transporter S component n=1 Tax=Calorimonas adulescens TaxID=2606906 RepID=A0A5D8QAA0_9THEO|nr:ECF transporter S component [Calorimonas adulescens]MDI6600588.1 ECF transporter S component [Thermoanaerobacteraceae bacterium]TZE80278.1 ECF transporter S component [Calorimonas adulescens]
MGKRSMWSFKFTTASLVLIPTAVGINYIGKFFASLLKLPLWLDSIGTMLSSMMAGPIVGAISGAINNIIYGLTADPISLVYAITSVAIGLTVGILAYIGWFKSWSMAVVSGLVVGLIAAIVSTPLNVIFWGGQTGNIWGDSVFAFLSAREIPIWIASFADEIIVDVPDKIATVLISYGIYKGLPRQLTSIYRNDDEIKEL